MYKNIRTDLAVEAREICETENNGEIDGVKIYEEQDEDVNVTTVDIINEIGETNMGKPIGSYITIDMPEFTHYDAQIMEMVSRVLAKRLEKLIKIEDNMTVLVAGLGNWNVTPDALGPKVVSKLMVTRHLKELIPDSIDEGIRPVCALAPGVLGITGMETSEIIKGVVGRIKPDLVICIDALASRKLDRINSTIQISNTGISPGLGVGNKRKELNEKTLGIPVIAIGVPTVVDAATMANDTIDIVIDEMIRQSDKDKEFYKMLKSVDKIEKENMIKDLLSPFVGNLVVTPKEVDEVVESVSKIIAQGINVALQPGLSLEDINSYVN